MPPRRGLGFTPREIQVLLTSIERILPIGMLEWDAVLNVHEREFPDGTTRTREGLKRKFASLYKLQMPTGDPNFPPDVLRAKRLYQEIKKKAEVAEGGEDEEEWDPDSDDASIEANSGNEDAVNDAGFANEVPNNDDPAAAPAPNAPQEELVAVPVQAAPLQVAPLEDGRQLHRGVLIPTMTRYVFGNLLACSPLF